MECPRDAVSCGTLTATMTAAGHAGCGAPVVMSRCAKSQDECNAQQSCNKYKQKLRGFGLGLTGCSLTCCNADLCNGQGVNSNATLMLETLSSQEKNARGANADWPSLL
ncbi:hypothetical protein OS493_020134 [Desmophyllum pertusum]|uniref:Uncharacterized protein n=1 Tax=Desmophyllum pertusum TaxID=174260 RepID=A0A9X0DAN1_9CNID|nr:hypothetical protein OS493_020134 [Desmophyllum pertusum]